MASAKKKCVNCGLDPEVKAEAEIEVCLDEKECVDCGIKYNEKKGEYHSPEDCFKRNKTLKKSIIHKLGDD